MIRFLSQIGPRIPFTGSNIMHHPECLTVVKESFLPSRALARNYVAEKDKQHPLKGGGSRDREERECMTMPGFINPVPRRSEGLLTQKIKQEIEEHKKRKDKPTINNPETRE